MKKEKTLREVCCRLGVSRRAVQGYEKMGLVRPTGHNERGYLLYDPAAQKRIEQIRVYQWLGFSLREIVQLIDAPDEAQLAALRVREEHLQAQQADMALKMKKIRAMIAEKEGNYEGKEEAVL